jgi:hypothetical protein
MSGSTCSCIASQNVCVRLHCTHAHSANVCEVPCSLCGSPLSFHGPDAPWSECSKLYVLRRGSRSRRHENVVPVCALTISRGGVVARREVERAEHSAPSVYKGSLAGGESWQGIGAAPLRIRCCRERRAGEGWLPLRQGKPPFLCPSPAAADRLCGDHPLP